jgi:hypothetical protein
MSRAVISRARVPGLFFYLSRLRPRRRIPRNRNGPTGRHAVGGTSARPRQFPDQFRFARARGGLAQPRFHCIYARWGASYFL